MHPCVFVHVFGLEEGVGDAEVLFDAELKESAAVFVSWPRSMMSDRSIPGPVECSDSRIEISHDNQLIFPVDFRYNVSEGHVESFGFRTFCV